MRILIADDGSDGSRKAIDECCRMFAKAKNLEIRVVSTYEAVIPLDAFGTSAQNADEAMAAAQKNAEDIVLRAKEEIKRRLPDAEIETISIMDYPERYLIEEAKTWRADLIVVGSHGRGFWGRLTLGSVSDSVIHHAPCSVFVARQGA